MAENGSQHNPDMAGYLELATAMVAAYVSNNNIDPAKIPELLTSLCDAMIKLDTEYKSALGQVEGGVGADHKLLGRKANREPPVPIDQSIKDDYIICLEDGRKLKMLKRYLANRYNMTTDEYRLRWGLPEEYPMVAPSVSIKRSADAIARGLGKSDRSTN